MSAASDGAKLTSSDDAFRSTPAGIFNVASSLTTPDAVTICSAADRLTGRRFSDASLPAGQSAVISNCVKPGLSALNVQYTGTLPPAGTSTNFSGAVRI